MCIITLLNDMIMCLKTTINHLSQNNHLSIFIDNTFIITIINRMPFQCAANLHLDGNCIDGGDSLGVLEAKIAAARSLWGVTNLEEKGGIRKLRNNKKKPKINAIGSNTRWKQQICLFLSVSSSKCPLTPLWRWLVRTGLWWRLEGEEWHVLWGGGVKRRKFRWRILA